MQLNEFFVCLYKVIRNYILIHRIHYEYLNWEFGLFMQTIDIINLKI